MNPQSTGFLRLRSKEPSEKLRIDPQFLSHPFDRRTAIEAIRHVMELIETPAMSKDTIRLVAGPKSKSDEDILVSGPISPWSQTLLPICHVNGRSFVNQADKVPLELFQNRVVQHLAYGWHCKDGKPRAERCLRR